MYFSVLKVVSSVLNRRSARTPLVSSLWFGQLSTFKLHLHGTRVASVSPSAYSLAAYAKNEAFSGGPGTANHVHMSGNRYGFNVSQHPRRRSSTTT